VVVQFTILPVRWFDSRFPTVHGWASSVFPYHKHDGLILFFGLLIFRAHRNPINIEMCKEVFQEIEL